MEHDFGRLYSQMQRIKQSLKKEYDAASTITDQSLRTKHVFDLMETDPNWYKSQIVLAHDEMDKNLPIISALRKKIPIVFGDSPSKISYPTLFAQKWDISRNVKGSKTGKTRDNAWLSLVYRSMWLTRRNHNMVNAINENVGEFYGEFMKKTHLEQQAKAKKNYVMFIGYAHWSSQRSDSGTTLTVAYKLGMDPMLQYPELFADAAFTKNDACRYDGLPYNKHFASIVSKAQISYLN
eukprot:UN07264